MSVFRKYKLLTINGFIVLIVLLLGFGLENLFTASNNNVYEYCANMNNMQEKAVDILVETNKLLVSLSLLVIGGMGSLVIRKNDTNYSNSMPLQIILIIGMLFSGLSIYFGYSLYIELTNTLSYNVYDIDCELILQFKSGQFLCFIASIVFGIVFLINHIIIANHETKN